MKWDCTTADENAGESAASVKQTFQFALAWQSNPGEAGANWKVCSTFSEQEKIKARRSTGFGQGFAE